MIFCFKMAKDQLFKHRKNVNSFSTPVCQIDIFVKLYLDFANDWGKNGKNGGYHVIEHLLMNKSRGGSFFKIFLFFWDSIRDMLLIFLDWTVSEEMNSIATKSNASRGTDSGMNRNVTATFYSWKISIAQRSGNIMTSFLMTHESWFYLNKTLKYWHLS